MIEFETSFPPAIVDTLALSIVDGEDPDEFEMDDVDTVAIDGENDSDWDGVDVDDDVDEDIEFRAVT